jgi:hypothetical protein
MALVYSDNILHEEEQKILDAMIKEFDLEPALAVVYSEWSKAILSLSVQGEALIRL